LDALAKAADVLLRHEDEEVRTIGAWLAGDGGGRAAALAQRDAILRSLRLPAPRLAAELRRYRGNAWRRDRGKADCPYPAGDLRASLWRVLMLSDRDLTERQIRRIRTWKCPADPM
jgi:hypothetical protein